MASFSDHNDIILLVDDDPDILQFLSYTLKKEGYKVYTANSGEEALKVVKDVQPALVILDVMMPDMDGIEVCQLIRDTHNILQPVITFLSSRNEDYSQIAGLSVGADDYIAKPIRPRLLVTKIKSLLRRKEPQTQDIPDQEQEIQIDRDRFVVLKSGEKIILPKKEFELLEVLVSKPGKVFTREQIMSLVWGNDAIVGERTIDVHIRKLREKLGNTYIRTVKGVGYTFNSD